MTTCCGSRSTPEAQPVAVALVEAKAENLPPGHGLELAKGISLDAPAAKPLLVRYAGGEATRRCYQDGAIRAVLEKIATGEKRALLSLATGVGKTFIAVHLLKRIADMGQLRRALFVCDRDELRSQGLAAFQAVFGGEAAEVGREAGGLNKARNARIHVATYQTLDVDSDEADANFLVSHYPVDHFSHIVIDECHRSAWGKWSQVLTRNPGAIQIGLTATPRAIEVTEKTKEAVADATGVAVWEGIFPALREEDHGDRVDQSEGFARLSIAPSSDRRTKAHRGAVAVSTEGSGRNDCRVQAAVGGA